MIRNLVIENQMSFAEVMKLTPYQIAALGARESKPPGEVTFADWRRIQAEVVRKFGEGTKA